MFVKRKSDTIVESRMMSSRVLCMELELRVMKRLEIFASRREERGQGRGSLRFSSSVGQSSTLREVGDIVIVTERRPKL